MWEFPAACYVMWMLQQPMKLKVSNSLLDYEIALLQPEGSLLLEEAFTKLLLDKKGRDRFTVGLGLSYTWWNEQLSITFDSLYREWINLRKRNGENLKLFKNQLDPDDDDDNEEEVEEEETELTDLEQRRLEELTRRLSMFGENKNPMEGKEFAELPIETRVRLLLSLCEGVLEQPEFEEHLRNMEIEDLRNDPFETNSKGVQYFYFPQFYQDRRIYRMNASGWILYARGLESLQALYASLGSVKRLSDVENRMKAYIKILIEELELAMEENLKNEERARKRALIEALPRKRSARIQVKQLVKFKEEKLLDNLENSEMEAEKLMNRKKEEILRRMEIGKNKEERRLLLEKEQREAAKHDREIRRKRRMEQDERAFKLEQDELQRRKEGEKRLEEREQRAQRRAATFSPPSSSTFSLPLTSSNSPSTSTLSSLPPSTTTSSQTTTLPETVVDSTTTTTLPEPVVDSTTTTTRDAEESSH